MQGSYSANTVEINRLVLVIWVVVWSSPLVALPNPIWVVAVGSEALFPFL